MDQNPYKPPPSPAIAHRDRDYFRADRINLSYVGAAIGLLLGDYFFQTAFGFGANPVLMAATVIGGAGTGFGLQIALRKNTLHVK